MKLYRFSMLVILLLIIAVATVTTIQVLNNNGVFKESEFAESSINLLYGFIIAIILITFCIVQIICLFTRKLTMRNLGFFILHAGLVLFLIGSFIYKMTGVSEFRDMPVNGVTYSQIGIQHETHTQVIDLGFGIGVKDFKVDKYDPIYDLYQKDGSGKWKRIMHDVEPDEKGILNFKTHGSLNEDIFEELGQNANIYQWSQDFIVLKRQPDKYYEATLIVHDLKKDIKNDVKLITNKPFRRNGWIVYLMSHNPNGSSIKVLFKYDPAEIISQIGLWLIIIGSFVMCFNVKLPAKKQVTRRKKNG